MNIKRVLVHGVILGSGVIVWNQINQAIITISILPGIILSILFVAIYALVILSFVKGQKINDRNTMLGLILTGALASILISFAYYLEATVLDPSHISDQIVRSQEKWRQLGYSEAQKGGQIELTDAFQNPLKWSGVLCGFNFGVFMVIGLGMMGTKFLRRAFRSKDDSTLSKGEAS